jgi:hypothetical protein
MLSDVTDNFVTIFEFNNNATKGEYLECSVRELYTRVYEDIYIKGNIEDSELRECLWLEYMACAALYGWCLE